MTIRHPRMLRALPWAVASMVAALPLFAHLGALPIRRWDESRLAFNALEMARGQSHFLVPTYGGVPDLWNVKPPLLIWIQALSLRLLGENELALRIPSALAALATLFLLLRFAQKWIGRPWLGVAAVAVLVTSKGYISLHGVRTGDYDALMTLFTTGYGLAWALFTEKGDRKMLWTTAACIAGAVLTKGVAGLLPLPALLLYSVFRGKIFVQLRNREFWLAAALVVAIAAGYYAGRDALNPGYLEAVRANELSGRFMNAIEDHQEPADWYLRLLVIHRFQWWLLWWAAGLVAGILSRDIALRRATLFSGLFCIVHLGVISSAGTKLEWYDLPVYPFAAFTAATGIYLLASIAQHRLARAAPAVGKIAVRVLAVSLFIVPFTAILDRVFNHRINQWDPVFENDAAAYLQDIHRGRRAISLDAFVWKGYYANLTWYRTLLYGPEGATEPTPLDSLRPGTAVYTFQEEVQSNLTARYAADTLDRYKGVIVYRIRQPR